MSRRYELGLKSALVMLLSLTGQRAWPQEPSVPAPFRPVDPNDRIVITVDDLTMKGADVEKFIDSLPPQYRAYYRGPGRAQLPQYLVQMKVLLEAAQKDNLQDLPEVKEAISIATSSIMADAERKHLEEKIPVSDKDIEDLYQKKKLDYEEVRIRHIVIPTDTRSIDLPGGATGPPVPEAEARKKLEDLRKQIAAGSDFAQLAKANSVDASTANDGGDMGYMNRQNLLPPIANAAFALNPGQVSEVISTPYGLEIIKVEDRHTKPLSEVRQDLIANIRKTKGAQAFQDELGHHKVVVDKTFFSSTGAIVSPAPR
ncbi:MAG TPA: peptidylprolyl isomerase [Terriglobia bacterium]|nr:peptidylprolyl isomerase [Terriglobia bacterium]